MAKATQQLPREIVFGRNDESAISFEEITQLPEIIDCWSTARRNLLTGHYGLTDARFLPQEYLHLLSHRYFRATQGSEVLGILRIIPSISMAPYFGNLIPELIHLIEAGTKFSDLGFYYTRKVPAAMRFRIIREVVAFSQAESLNGGIEGLYIQIPKRHEIFYQRLGFNRAGGDFQAPGWSKIYVPMYLLCTN